MRDDMWYTLRDRSISSYTTNQSEARWIYDVIRTDESTRRLIINEWNLNWWKSLITSVLYLDDITPPRSSSDFGCGRRNYSNCRECTAGHLLRNVNDISSITPAKLNDNRAERTTHLIFNSFTIEETSTQTTVTNKTTASCRQRFIYVVRTLNRRWKLTECAHRSTNGHRHHYYLSNEQLTINRRD